VHVPQADHVPLVHVRDWVPQSPQGCVLAPEQVQDPATQLEPPGQALPHAPQLLLSLVSSTQALVHIE
jgi:hypothetical protein